MKQVNKLLNDELKNTQNKLKESIAKQDKLIQEVGYIDTEINMLQARCLELAKAILSIEEVKEVPVVKTTSKNKKTKS